ncbi:MAG: Hpt domain-containing protein [Planctomycetota bacterium]
MDTTLDPAALLELQACDEDGSLIAELLVLYQEESPARLAALRAAFERGDAREVSRQAHALISASAQLGGVGLAAQCRRLQTTAAALAEAGQAPGEDIAEQIESIRAEQARVLAALSAWVAQQR